MIAAQPLEQTPMIYDLAALCIIITILGFCVYTQVPKHWQTKIGFLVIVFGWMPAALIGFSLFKQPALLIPAALIAGIVINPRKRPS